MSYRLASEKRKRYPMKAYGGVKVRLACDKFNSFLTSGLDGLTNPHRSYTLVKWRQWRFSQGRFGCRNNHNLEFPSRVEHDLYLYLEVRTYFRSRQCLLALMINCVLCSPQSLSRREFPNLWSVEFLSNVACSPVLFFMFNQSVYYCVVCLYIFLYIQNYSRTKILN